jgi:hypothetical protein
MLNEKQQQVYDRVIKERAPITYLTGEAGTGKSFTVSQIIHDIPSILTASTHKAKSVLSQMTGRPSQTVHKYFGFRLTNINYKQVLVQNGNHDLKETRLLVIDEVSMLPDRILTAALEALGDSYDQLLFVGDPIQLPAVSNKPKLAKLAKHQINLTEQMRQQPCDKLASYMDTYRTAIKEGNLPELGTEAPAIELIDDHKVFCRKYVTCEGNKKIIAYRNNVVEKYNANINDGDTFNIGDAVILDKPIGQIAHNQDVVIINDLEELDDYYSIRVVTDNGSMSWIRHYKASSKLTKLLGELQLEGNENGYWDLFDKSFRLKHVYASTVHKSQGESIDYVFLDALDIVNAYETPKSKYNNPINLDLMLRLLYVGISRMKIKCYIYTGDDDRGRWYNILQESAEQAERNLKRKKPIKNQELSQEDNIPQPKFII